MEIPRAERAVAKKSDADIAGPIALMANAMPAAIARCPPIIVEPGITPRSGHERDAARRAHLRPPAGYE